MCFKYIVNVKNIIVNRSMYQRDYEEGSCYDPHSRKHKVGVGILLTILVIIAIAFFGFVIWLGS